MKTYRIKDWNLHFEKAQTRKCQEMKWVAIPNKHDGKSYGRLTHVENWLEVFAVWILLLEVASKCPVRGVLADNDGPLGDKDLEFKTRCPAASFKRSVSILQDVGWIEVISDG
jgi:hypothetical protein